MRSRAFRRQKLKNKKLWAERELARYYMKPIDTRTVCIRASSPKICSCPMCGNPRKHFNSETMQELKAKDAQMAQLVDVADSKSV